MDKLLADLSPLFDERFATVGRLLVPPEHLLNRPREDDSGDNNGFADFKGTRGRNDTHESKTDPEARLFHKGRGKEAKLAYMGHVLMENRNGLVADFALTEANGTAEREAGYEMAKREQRRRRNRKARSSRMTLGAEKNYDTRGFVKACRDDGIVPQVTPFQHARRRSAIDHRTTRHPGDAVSQTARMLIEKLYGWMKAVAVFRRSRYRGRRKTAFAGTMVAAANNLIRLTKLQPST